MFKKTFLIFLFFGAINFVNAQDSVPQNVSDTLFFEQENIIIANDTATTDSVEIPKKENLIKQLINGNLNWSLAIAPSINLQPETSWGFGFGGAYYIKPKIAGKKTGLINFSTIYTLRNQFFFKTSSTAYLDKEQKFVLYSSADFRHFPDNFYGIGNRKENLLQKKIGYNSNNITVILQPQRYLKRDWLVGINTHFRWENAKADSAHFKQLPMQIYGVDGFNEYFMLGFGGLVSHDSRDNILYPQKGLFLKTTFTFYPKICEKSYQMGRIAVDFRHFIPIYKGLIFAYQISSEMNFTNGQKPFQMLATIGGAELLRGVRQSNWRDDAMVALQAELRIPIWKIFKGAVFAGIGDVYSFENWQWAKPKVGYGAGLRINFNKSGANIRIDVARNNFDKSFRFNTFNWYITMNEAF